MLDFVDKLEIRHIELLNDVEVLINKIKPECTDMETMSLILEIENKYLKEN